MDDWFDSWVQYHATLFGLDTDGDLKTLLSWRRLFVELNGFTAEELHAASDDLAAPPVPRFRNEHLDRLQAAVQARRSARRRKVREAEDAFAEDADRCTLCHGAGMAVVPHPSQVDGPTWAGGATCAVFCSCRAGAAESSRHADARRKPMALEKYEGLNPCWPEQLRAREALDRERRLAREKTREADRTFGRILSRLESAFVPPF